MVSPAADNAAQTRRSPITASSHARVSRLGWAIAWLLLCIVAVSSSLITQGHADTAILSPSADTALLETFPTNNFGGQTWLNAGTTQNFTTNRGLLKFDLRAHVPPGAKITAATVTLEVTRRPSDGDNPTTFDLHRMLRDWGEGNKSGNPPQLGAPATVGEATWTHRFALTTNTWAAPGGLVGVDFAEASSSQQFIYDEVFSPYVFPSRTNLVTDIQHWLDNPDQNFGWMLKTRVEDLDFTARRFASREAAFGGAVLEVHFAPLRLEQITVANGLVTLQFNGEAGETYSIERCDRLPSQNWQTVTNIAELAVEGPVIITDTVEGSEKFYRLVRR